MKKSIIAILLFLFGAQSWAQQPVKSLLWKISGKDLTKPSYIYGTIHLIAAKDFIIHPALDSLVSGSEKLVLEMDLSNMGDQMKLMGKMMLDSGKVLKDLYTEKQYTYIKEKLQKSYSIPVDGFAKFKPIMLQQTILSRAMFGKDVKSYELFFMEISKKKSLPILGLESLDDQVKALNSISNQKQADMLYNSLKHFNKEKKELTKMIELYKNNDVDALYKITTKDKNYADNTDDLLVNRNKNWIPIIKENARKSSLFIAVGAAHLGGDEGVLNLLRKEGYTVEPIL